MILVLSWKVQGDKIKSHEWMGLFSPSSAHPTSNLFKRKWIVKCCFDVSWSCFDANHQSNYTRWTHPHLVKRKKYPSSLMAILALLTFSSFSNSNTFPKAPARISSALRDADVFLAGFRNRHADEARLDCSDGKHLKQQSSEQRHWRCLRGPRPHRRLKNTRGIITGVGCSYNRFL